jgi:hypothetical protein
MNDFFADSDYLDHMVLRALSHIRMNWELAWDRKTRTYFVEENSYAGLLNASGTVSPVANRRGAAW